MQVTTRLEQGRNVIAPSGRLDTLTAPEFAKNFAAWTAQERPRLVLDLAGVEYISSAGLRALLELAKKAKAAGGSLCLCNLRPFVREVIALAGLDKVLVLQGTLAEALALA